MATTQISWSNFSWNPITGCTKYSDGCGGCYAQRFTHRLQKSPLTSKYVTGFDQVVCHPECLDEPRKWKKGRRVFVCSMADLFHQDVPEEFIQQVFAVINSLPQHQFQILTKRSERMAEMAPRLTWPDNIWAGVTVEADKYLYRLDHLRQVPARIRCISAEPLLTPLANIDLTGIHWIVVGGESGKGARHMNPQWARDIKMQCDAAGVVFFFKQHGDNTDEKDWDLLDGVRYHQYPA